MPRSYKIMDMESWAVFLLKVLPTSRVGVWYGGFDLYVSVDGRLSNFNPFWPYFSKNIIEIDYIILALSVKLSSGCKKHYRK